MGGMEFNKIFAAVLVAGIVASLSGFVAKKLVHPEKLEENAFKIEAVDAGGSTAKKEKLPEPVLAMVAGADVARGQKLSKACAACHSFDKGAPNGVGPNLWGIVNRPKESISNFAYSGALKAQGGEVWTYENINAFLWKPKWYAPGTKMTYAGMKKPEDRAALLAWIRTLSDSPASLPSEAEIAAEQAKLLPEDVAEETVSAAESPAEGTADGTLEQEAVLSETVEEGADSEVPAQEADAE